MKIRIKSGTCPSYLTEGKIYEAKVLGRFVDQGLGPSFEFRDDKNILTMANLLKSGHLNGGDFEIVEE